ncbi:MAG: twin-arginine translocation signal domain-containing protein, partial [Candidatus Hydrogenedentes bacterium]|nr:twin-arginine translocation signal domain-containing protein [Candidatus Hydrogenedentota bacterium]
MDVSRRSFLKTTALIPALGAMPGVSDAAAMAGAVRPKKPAVVRGAFFYPPLQVVLDGKCEDDWHIHNWCTWPGNQYQPEQQQKKFEHELERISQGLDVKLMIDSAPIYTDAGISTFISEVAASKPDALLLFNFWNSFSAKIVPILDAFPGPIILYHPLGANHQLPPEKFRTAPRVQYIHSMENFDAIERGLRAVHAMARMKQSRVLRVSGQVTAESDEPAPFFNCAVHTVPADQFNNLFDETALTDDLRKLARKVHAHALDVKDLADSAFDDAV